MDHPAEVPTDKNWVRSLDVDGGAWVEDRRHRGAQFFGIQSEYLDPDVNAFVGMIFRGTRFNEHIKFGDPAAPSFASALFNWGVRVGIVRGPHTWEIDLMGANLGEHLAFGPAIGGEHVLAGTLKLYHRTIGEFFEGETVLDSDQGLSWMPWKTVGFNAGYRIFTGQHLRHSGPRAGFQLRFDTPRLPFIFPSIG
jgi:hypothetical protein